MNGEYRNDVHSKRKNKRKEVLCVDNTPTYFVNAISIDETFEVRPSSLVIDSVPMRISLIFASWTNRFLVISAASTALLIALPRALMTTSVDPLLNCVTTART